MSTTHAPKQTAGSASATEFVVIRHGETVWNSERRMQGQMNSDLSELGRAQALALGLRMRNERFDVLYSSDLARAHLTAQAIADQTGHEIRPDTRLRERSFGIFEGLTHAEMKDRNPEEYVRFRQRDPDYSVPGGETPREFFQRSLACFNELAALHPGARVVVVAHGLILDTLYRAANGHDLTAPRTLDLINASLNIFRHDSGRWQMLAWGDRSHLETITVYQEGSR